MWWCGWWWWWWWWWLTKRVPNYLQHGWNMAPVKHAMWVNSVWFEEQEIDRQFMTLNVSVSDPTICGQRCYIWESDYSQFMTFNRSNYLHTHSDWSNATAIDFKNGFLLYIHDNCRRRRRQCLWSKNIHVEQIGSTWFFCLCSEQHCLSCVTKLLHMTRNFVPHYILCSQCIIFHVQSENCSK